MSAACVVLPVRNRLPSVRATAERIAAGARKGPHGVRLAEPQNAQPAQPRYVHRSVHRSVRAIPEPELAFYRKYTEAMLRRTMKLSMEAGRVPSTMGRDLFRGKVSQCKVRGFDDAVIFVHDMRGCLDRLSPGQRALVERIAMQGYTQSETAAMLGICLRTVVNRYAQALDLLTGMLLQRKLLEPMS